MTIRLQPDDNKVIHPLTWQYLFKRWITRGIGPQRQSFRREPNREQLDSSLWDTSIVTWL